MLVFIDESGCSGFKLTRGSDAVFAIGMVVFDTPQCAARVRDALRTLRKNLGHKPEFKFSRFNDRLRDAFFAGVTDLPFGVRAVVVEKTRVLDAVHPATHDAFYDFFLKQLLQRAQCRMRNAKLRVDGVAGRQFERSLKRDLRRLLPGKIDDVRTADSRRDDLMQLADMCIGAIARAHRPMGQCDRWLRLLAPRIEEVWTFR